MGHEIHFQAIVLIPFAGGRIDDGLKVADDPHVGNFGRIAALVLIGVDRFIRHEELEAQMSIGSAREAELLVHFLPFR